MNSSLTAAVAALACLATSCLHLGYDARRQEQPVDEALVDGLVPRRDDLGACLARLGAPSQVFEYQGDGVALAYVCRDEAEWSLDASVPVVDFYRLGNATLSLDLGSADQPSVVLWFGPDLQLAAVRRGRLGSLLAGARTRAQPTDADR